MGGQKRREVGRGGVSLVIPAATLTGQHQFSRLQMATVCVRAKKVATIKNFNNH